MRPIDSIAPIKGTSNRAGKFRPARFSCLRIQRGEGSGERLKTTDMWEGFAEWLAKSSTRLSLKRSLDSFTLHLFIMRYLLHKFKRSEFDKMEVVNRTTI